MYVVCVLPPIDRSAPTSAKHICAEAILLVDYSPPTFPSCLLFLLPLLLHLLPSLLSIIMRTSSARYSTFVVEQAEYFTLGLHLPQHSDDPSSRALGVDCSAASVATSTDLYVQMSCRPSSYSTTAPPTSRPSPSLEQLRSSTANMSKRDYCKAHLSRDAPFAAFRLVGSGSNGGVGASTAMVVSRKSVDVNPAIQTVSRAFTGAGPALSWTSKPAMNLTHCYPTEITDEDLLEMDARNTSPRL